MRTNTDPIRVLYVDGERDVTERVAAALEGADDRIQVATVATAEEALGRLRECDVDCVVSEYAVPDRDGIAFLDAVRDRHPDLPFVLFTCDGSEAVASEAISAGVTDYVRKGEGTDTGDGTESRRYDRLATRVTDAVEQFRGGRNAAASERVLEIVENTTDVLWMVSADWSELLFVNSQYEELWGRPVSALERDPTDLLNGVYPADRERVENAMERLSRGESVDLEYRVGAPEGDRRWVWVRGTPIVDETGTAVRIVGVARDVTDRKDDRRRLSALQETARRLIRAETPSEVASIATEAARDVLGLSVNSVYFYEPSRDALVPVANTAAALDLFGEPPVFERGEGIAWRVYERGDPRVFDDVRTAENVYDPETVVRSELVWPLGSHGVFLAGSTAPGEFDEGATALAQVLAASVEAALDRTRDLQRLRSRERKIQALQERTRDLIRAASKREIAEVAVETAKRTLDLPFSVVNFVDDDGETLVPAAATDEVRDHFGSAPAYHREDPSRSVDALHWDAFERGETVVLDDVRDHEDVSTAETPTRSGVVHPLGDHGVLITTSPRPEDFDETDVAFGELLAAVVTATLDQVEREEQLRRERERFKTLFDRLPVPVVHARLDGGDAVVQRANDEFQARFGRGREPVVGEPLEEFVALPDSDEGFDDVESQLLAEGRVDGVVRRETAEGVREFRTEVVLRASGPGTLDAYAIYLDVTEQRRRRAVLETLHDVSRELIGAEDRDAVATLVVDAAAEILDFPLVMVRFHDADEGGLVPVAWNDAVEDVFGDRRTFTRGGGSLTWEAFEDGEIRLYDDVGEIDSAIDTDTPLSTLMILPLGEYGTVTVGSTVAGAFDEGDAYLARILATTAEAALSRTEREDELERTNERLEEFASIVSHDLRNPLGVAQGRLELAREECDSPHLEAVAGAHDRMQALIDDLLAVAREGTAAIDPEPVDLDEAARACWETVDTAAATLVVDTDRTVRADRSGLQQVLENLVRNSVEHGGATRRTASADGSDAGTAEANHGTGRRAADAGDPDDGAPADGGVTITVGDLADGFYVEDDGSGIPTAERGQVFEAGYSNSAGGTGFGLAIVDGIADAHGWEVSVAGSAAGGARFEFTGVDVVEG
jgi:PAS domain S-box-containing protein